MARLYNTALPLVLEDAGARPAFLKVGSGQVKFYVGLVPLLGLLVIPWVLETKDRTLAD